MGTQMVWLEERPTPQSLLGPLPQSDQQRRSSLATRAGPSPAGLAETPLKSSTPWNYRIAKNKLKLSNKPPWPTRKPTISQWTILAEHFLKNRAVAVSNG